MIAPSPAVVASTDGVRVVTARVADVFVGLHVTVVATGVVADAGEAAPTIPITLITSDITTSPIEPLKILFILLSLISV